MNGKEDVWAHVEDFRRRYLVGDLAYLPVDVFTLTEIEFKLDIIPFDDLYEKYEVDAALMHDFSGRDLQRPSQDTPKKVLNYALMYWVDEADQHIKILDIHASDR